MMMRYRTRPIQTQASSTRAAGPRRAADAFLSAEVGVQKNGMTLSVISMLSRQDIDPWAEVDHLSTLGRGEAVARLTAIILVASVSLPDDCSASTLASNLVSLLPAFESGTLRSAIPPSKFNLNSYIPLSERPEATSLSGARLPVHRLTPHGNRARLLVVLAAAVTLIVISIVQPKSIPSSSGGANSTNVTAGTSPAVSAQPRH